MLTYLIADLHFGHENIIKYCNRPFKNSQDMDEQLIKNWNNVVSKNDRVYILGDFSLSCKEDVIKGYVDRLNGQKYLIMGNHDVMPVKKYYNCGFDFVNKMLNSEIETVYIMSDKNVESISSSFIRELIKHGRPYEMYVFNSDENIEI